MPANPALNAIDLPMVQWIAPIFWNARSERTDELNYYTDVELAALLASGESHIVERKRNAGDTDSIRRNICTFANDLPGHRKPGVIFVGVEDDGECSELSVTDELLRVLAQMRSDGAILPFPTMTVEKKTVSACELAVVQVMPATNPPLRYKGRAWIKVGPTVQQATPGEEQRLVERQMAGRSPFDMRPATDSALVDLDVEYVRETYLPSAVAREVLELNQRPLTQQLQSLRLLRQGFPAHGALIAFGRDPQYWAPGAYVQFLRFAGVSITDPIKSRKELTGKLEDVLSRVNDLIEINISVSTDVASRPREVRLPDYPIEALRQLTANAVMHRSYESTNAPSRIYWYDDRIEIQSPGGLYGNVTPTNIHDGVTDYRNPLVAEIMHHLGFAQRFGLGIQLAKASLQENGNTPPEFSFSSTHVSVIVRGLQ